MHPQQMYEYLARARARLFDWIRPPTAERLPSFAALEAAWADLGITTRAVLNQITAWDEPVEYRMLPQAPGAPA